MAVTKQILKGLNTIVLRIATETPTDKSLCVLLPLLTKCCMVKHGVLEVGTYLSDAYYTLVYITYSTSHRCMYYTTFVNI